MLHNENLNITTHFININGSDKKPEETLNTLTSIEKFENPKVLSIEITYADLSLPGAVEKLANIININKNSITTFKLANVKLSAEGIKLLTEALKNCNSLQEFNLYKIDLSSEQDMNSIAKLIKQDNKCLTKFSLSACQFLKEHANLIAEALEVNKSITYFDISNPENVNGEDLLPEMLKTIEKSTSITQVIIMDNDFTKISNSNALCNLITNNKSINYFNFLFSIFNTENYERIVNAFKDRKFYENPLIIGDANLNKMVNDALDRLNQEARYMFARMIKRLTEKEQQANLPRDLLVDILEKATENTNEMKYYRERVLQQQNNNNITAQGHNQ